MRKKYWSLQWKKKPGKNDKFIAIWTVAKTIKICFFSCHLLQIRKSIINNDKVYFSSFR